jgi:hypothetical protein
MILQKRKKFVKRRAKKWEKIYGKKVEATTTALDGGRLRACSNCGFLRPIDRKNPDSRALLEPARKNFGVCNAKIPDFEQALR